VTRAAKQTAGTAQTECYGNTDRLDKHYAVSLRKNAQVWAHCAQTTTFAARFKNAHSDGSYEPTPKSEKASKEVYGYLAVPRCA